jgi:hypothetical protein
MLTAILAALSRQIESVLNSDYDKCIVVDGITEESSYIKDNREKQVQYLLSRNKRLLTNHEFTPTIAADTDVRRTMRQYIEQCIPAQKEQYSSLFR